MQDTVRQPYHEETISTGLRLEVEGAASDFWPQQLGFRGFMVEAVEWLGVSGV